MALLEIRNVTKSFGGLVAVHRVDMALEQGEILGLIGPNGAGKTTLFNLIAGVYRPDEGQILLRGEDITYLQCHQICQRRVARTFQLVKPFANLTVLENVIVGAFNGTASRVEAQQRAREVLAFADLRGRKDQLAKSLTTADRKRLELARALATEPQLLLLDEVMAGLTATESTTMVELIRKVRDSGITIFVIEHVMRAIMALSDRIAVLHHGELIAQGTPEEISRNERVIEAYLGEAYLLA